MEGQEAVVLQLPATGLRLRNERPTLSLHPDPAPEACPPDAPQSRLESH
jgi:hypothetical protein